MSVNRQYVYTDGVFVLSQCGITSHSYLRKYLRSQHYEKRSCNYEIRESLKMERVIKNDPDLRIIRSFPTLTQNYELIVSDQFVQ